jgi:hypothetical protein
MSIKKASVAILIAVAASVLVITVASALFTNGNFETGDWTGWTKSTFINNGLSQAHGTGGTDLSAIVGGPSAVPLSIADPNSGGNLLYPAYGHFSARVNSELSYTGGGYARNANTITQTSTVTNADVDATDSLVHVRFVYSAVMVEPVYNPHTSDQKPYIYVVVKNASNADDVLYEFYSYVGEPGKNWQQGPAFAGGQAGDNWQYLDWVFVDIASSVAHPVSIGDNITVEVTAAGCSLGGHPGYAYVDEFNSTIPAPIISASGPATTTPGATYTYTITYKAILAATNAVIHVNIPAQTTFHAGSLSDSACSEAAGVITCNYASLPAGTTDSFTFDVDVSSSASGVIHLDTYNIQADSTVLNSGPTVDTTIEAPPANLGITASGAATLKPGDQYIYTFDYTTDATVNNTQVTFTLPTHTTYVSDSGSFCSSAAGTVTCDLGTISSNGSFTVTTLVDKLKKIGTNHVLAGTDYNISASGVAAVDGSATVSALVITPFADVDVGYWAIDYIQSIWAYGITSGCQASPLTYCPEWDIPRADTAIYVERGVHGGSFDPGTPPLTFTDTATHYAKYFIEALRSDGITAGCTPTTFCPGDSTTRAQMAILLLRGKYGSSYVPPATTNMWPDVPSTYWAANWCDRLGVEGISSGCGNGLYCPDLFVTRAQMAVLVQRTFQLTMPTP